MERVLGQKLLEVFWTRNHMLTHGQKQSARLENPVKLKARSLQIPSMV
jgi:hypothetical protein